MRTKLASILFSHSHSLSKHCNYCPPPPKNILFALLSRFISSDNCGNLQGLIDSEDQLLSFDNSKSHSVSIEEFSFLRDSLLFPDSDKPIHRTANAGISSLSNESAASIARTILTNGDDFGINTLKFLRQFRENLSQSFVVDVLNQFKYHPNFAIKFFIWAGRQIGYHHTLPVYNALLDIIECQSDRDRIPTNFLLEIKDDDKEVLGKLLNVLIRKYCQNGSWNAALEELGRLKDLGYRASRLTYNALVQAFLRAERLDSASLVHREMMGLGYRLDEFTLGCFAYTLCKTGKGRDALSLIEKEECAPDTRLYTKMISGLCEASLFEEAMDFLNRMRASSCIPNVVTYRILLCGSLNKKQLGRCKRIINMMISEGCYPSPGIFNSLVHAYCRSGDHSYAYKLLKKMLKCGYQPGYVVYNILIGGICGSDEFPSLDVLGLAEKAYDEMLERGLVLNKGNVCNFTRSLCHVGKFEKAYNIIREMMSKGFIPDTDTYSNVIYYLCNASKVEKAFQLFQEMKGNGITPNVYTYTILIDSFCKVGLIEQAHKWFDEMQRDGCAPNVVTYTALIHAYLKVRKLPNANEIFEMMVAKGCAPNVVTYTALIDGHCKAGETEKACQIYARMKNNKADIPDVDMYFRITDNESKEPNVLTYGALVDGLCKAHKIKEARDLLEAMSAEGCEPNQIVYDALIDGFCKAGKLDEAQEVFTKMLGHGYAPNIFTYSSLIDRLFKDKRLDLALKVLSKMLENSCAPNVVIYTEMIDGLCKVGKTDEAYKLMLMMEEKGCYPNVVTYTAMIDGFGKAGRVHRCLELLQQMASKGCAPNFITYRVLINHYCSAGLLDEAHKLLEEMKQTYWPKNIGTYRKVIEGFTHEFIASLGLLTEMSENDSMPILPAYKLLIDNYIKAGRLEIALDLHEELSTFSASYNKTYISLIESLVLACKFDKAYKLCTDMIKKGYVPELSLLVCLIKGIFRNGKWEEALQLLDCICQMGCQFWSICIC